jgi:glycosyltransferase involved in cell wall biosynthesis
LQQRAWLRTLANAAERQVMRRTDANVFVSHADQTAARVWRLLPPDSAGLVIHNGIDLAAISPLRCNEGADRTFDVVFIGRLVEQKDPELAIKVLASLASAGYRCQFAGGGPLRASCRRMLASMPGGNEVAWRGELSHSEALSLLAQTRVLIMPSRWEGLPILPMEAMALGVPIVATRLDGIAEVVEDGMTGVLTPSGDAAAMVAAVKRLLTTPSLWRQMELAGIARVERGFGQASSAAAYAALYERLLAVAV